MKIWVDSNPKSYAIVFESGKIETGKFDKPLTNNEAEYTVIIKALEIPNFQPLEILSDSQLVIKQLTLEYFIREDRLRELAQKVWKLAQNKFLHQGVTFHWVPRIENKAGKILG